MKESCRFCGRLVEVEDAVGWRFFGIIGKFDGMEAEGRVNEYAPGLCAEG